MDLEDKNYVPTELQSDVEHEELMQDPMMEQQPWDRVWAYCVDCGTRGDVYEQCKKCYGETLNFNSGYSSQEEDDSGGEERHEE